MLPFSDKRKQWYKVEVLSGALHIQIEPAAWQYCVQRLPSSGQTIRGATVVQAGLAGALPSYIPPTIPDYRPPMLEAWGFGKVLYLVKADRDWVEWSCLLPRVYADNAETKAHARAVVLTLSVLFKTLNQYGLENGPQTNNVAEQQLAIVSLYTTSGFVGYPLSAHLSPAVALGIRRAVGPQKNILPLPNVDEAMAEAYRAMTDRSVALGASSTLHSMLLLSGGVQMHFPGTQSVLRGYEHTDTHVIELTSDKVGSPEHQLAFLAGLMELLKFIRPKIL